MGHVRNYTIGDVIARYKDCKVIMFSSDGLGCFWNASRKCSQTKQYPHPKNGHKKIFKYEISVEKTWLINRLGLEISTCDEDYYKHQQEIF